MFEAWALMLPTPSVVQASLRDAVGILVGICPASELAGYFR